MTDKPAQHPWAKYYAERGLARPAVAEFVAPAASIRKPAADNKETAMAAELAAAVATVTAQVAVPGSSTSPFITAKQREAVARELKRRSRIRHARFAGLAAIALVGLHFFVTRVASRTPAPAALQAHIQSLPDALLPFFSSTRQPLQVDGVTIVQADQIDGQHYRYVANVTLRLRKPLYAPATTNGTATYRRLQEALQAALEQQMRFNIFSSSEEPDVPEMPLLLQRMHQAGETISIRVPFIARRFGWRWRLDAPQVALHTANRMLQGDSLDRYADTPYLIFGAPETLAEVRARIKQASKYVVEVAKAVQRHADVPAIQDPNALPALADAPALPAEATAVAAQANIESRPAVDPDAPAIVLPDSVKLLAASRKFRR